MTGGTHPALNYKSLKSLKIILPPIEIQNEIVTETKNRFAKVTELRCEAVVEQAKESRSEATAIVLTQATHKF